MEIRMQNISVKEEPRWTKGKEERTAKALLPVKQEK